MLKGKNIEEILIGQIKETVIQIFNWKDGTYEFTPQEVPIDKEIPISLDTQHLLMEGLRIVDEWTLIEGKITLDSVFVKRTEQTEDMTDEEREIFSLVDGENDVSTIIDITGKDDFIVSKTFVSLLEKGAIELKEDLSMVSEAPLLEQKKVTARPNILPIFIIVIAFALSFAVIFLNKTDIFKKFDASKAVNNLRIKIEAYRFKNGHYPESLNLVTNEHDPWGNPYIYKKDDQAYVVISKGADGEEGTSDDIFLTLQKYNKNLHFLTHFIHKFIDAWQTQYCRSTVTPKSRKLFGDPFLGSIFIEHPKILSSKEFKAAQILHLPNFL